MNFTIIEQIAILGERDRTGFQLELNLVSWSGKLPKYDIRRWDQNHESMTKGITISYEVLQTLFHELNRFFYEKKN